MRKLLLTAALLTITIGGPAQAAGSNLFLRVGAGINAAIHTSKMHLWCGDDASCRFEVPANSTFYVVATGARRPSRWSGCVVQSDPNICRVDVQGDAAFVTVR
jgi:hypothetical protein